MQLLSLAKAQSGELACARCGAEVRIVPGCSYAERDGEVFEELSDVVAEGNLTPTEALGLAQAVQHALWSGSYSAVLETLVLRLPGLVPVQVAAGRNSGAQRRALGMLKTVLDAMATARRSAVYSVVADSGAPPVSKG